VRLRAVRRALRVCMYLNYLTRKNWQSGFGELSLIRARMPADPAVAETVERNVEDICWAAGPALPDVISNERS